MPLATYLGEYQTPAPVGPVFQCVVPSALHTIGSTTVSAAGSVSSPVLPSDGYKVIAVAATSTQAGAIQVQRYVDAAGTILQGTVLSQTLAAATPAVLNGGNDGLVWTSFKITVTNSGGSAATLSGVAVVMQAA